MPRLLLVPALLILASAAGGVVPVEFPGPALIGTPGTTTAGCEVPQAGGAPSRVLLGTDRGYVVLAGYQSFLDAFNLLGSHLESGRVTGMTLLPGVPGGPRELAVAFADPDRLVLLDLNTSLPWFAVQARFDLDEDPGAVAAPRDASGGGHRVVVALPGIDRLESFVRDGDGWRHETALDAGDDPADLVAADLDGDGPAELVVANAGALSRSLHVFRADGGTLALAQDLPLPAAPAALTVVDRDRDGREELVAVAADTALAWNVDGADGELAVRGELALRIVATGLDTAFRPDGSLGLYLAGRERGLVEVFGRAGVGWEPEDIYYPSCRPRELLSADFNGDGRVDVVSVGGALEAATVMYGTASDGLHGYPVLSLTGRPGGAAVGDVDGDGLPDAVVTIADANSLNTFLGQQEGFEPEPRRQIVSFVPGSAAVLQADADPGQELAVASVFEGSVRILARQADGSFADEGRVDLGVPILQVRVPDVDGDGRADLLVLTANKPEVRVCFAAGDGSFPTVVTESYLWQARSLQAVDLDGDGDRELVSADGYGRVSYMPNLDGRSFGAEVRVNADAGSRLLALADLDNDQDEDVLVGNPEAASLTLLENDGAGNLVRRVGSYALAGAPAGVLGEDVNQDGIVDLVVNRRADGRIGIHFGLGDWTYAEVREFLGGDDVAIFTSGDFNGDLVPDLLTLDETLELGLTMLNVERVTVDAAPSLLAATCAGDALVVELRPPDAAGWRLSARADGVWRTLATASGAVHGALSRADGAWRLRLDAADLASAGLAAGAELRLESADPLSPSLVRRAAPCGDAGVPDGGLAWAEAPWPNPFNPVVRARFTLARAARVEVGVYDLQGRRVARLLSGPQPAGDHVVRWDGRGAGRDAAAGVYLLRVAAGRAVITHKLVLVR